MRDASRSRGIRCRWRSASAPFVTAASFSASANDVLVYRTADTDFQLTWFDRQGAVSGRASEPGGFRGVALSPDGARAVASRTNPQDTTKADLWLFDLSRGSGATRLTLGTGLAEFPVWSPDGKRIVFTFNNSWLRQKLASGEGDEKELLRSISAVSVRANSWSPDGRFLLYATAVDEHDHEIGSLGASIATIRSRCRSCGLRFNEEQGRFSPNGRWVAYVSNQSGAERSLRPRVCDGLQRRLRQHRRQCAGLPRRRHRAALAWGWPRALLSRAGRENDGRRSDRPARSSAPGRRRRSFRRRPARSSAT